MKPSVHLPASEGKGMEAVRYKQRKVAFLWPKENDVIYILTAGIVMPIT